MADRAAPITDAIEIRIDGSPGTLAAVGGAVRAMAVAAGLDPDRATRFRVVAEELVREALAREHAEGANDVVVRARGDGGMLHVEVHDRGLPMTGAESRRAPSRRLAALGFVDELHIATRGSEGNVAACAISVTGPDRAVVGDVLDPNAPDATDDEARAVDVRAMTVADAVGLARCIYRCYGYTYKDHTLYEPRHIAHAVRSGLMQSVVAVTPGGDVVGHSALFVQRAGDPVPEAGKLVVDPRYRGHHLAERMASVRLDHGRGEGLVGFWAQAVTNHPGSQKEIIHVGGAEVGLLIGASPSTVVMADLANVNEGRRSLVAMYTPLRRVAHTIFPPARHAGVIGEMRDTLALDRTIVAGEESPGGATKVRVMVVPDAGIAYLRIERIGSDVLARVAHELEGLDAFDLGAVHLDLPLTDPAASTIGPALERLGFCFAGWLPGFGADGDVLRLQRVGSHPVDVDHIVCARPEGERVRDYVVADWHRVRRGGVA
jgi:GNAT superfamily N-acetyltransferase